MQEINDYIAAFPSEIQEKLATIRAIFRQLLPNLEESIRYGIPSFKVGKHHLYFAAYKKYIGFYPVYGLEDMAADLAEFRAKGTKDTLHFSHAKPLPIELIAQIIRRKSELP